MKITMTATPIMTEVDDVPVRVWEGVTEGGARCQVYVCRIALPPGQDAAEFETELRETLPPGEYVSAVELMRRQLLEATGWVPRENQ